MQELILAFILEGEYTLDAAEMLGCSLPGHDRFDEIAFFDAVSNHIVLIARHDILTSPSLSDGAGGEDGKFKESEGTGMGEGQGARDVSDQLEDEDQLLGAQPAGAEQQRDEPDQASGAALLQKLGR